MSAVRRIHIKRDGKFIPTKHLILTFDIPKLPKFIKAGYLHCNTRLYIPNPLRCFQCQHFGHWKTAYRGKVTCARCSVAGHESENCKEPARCVNCQKDHPSYSKNCERWKIEKEIQTVKTIQNVSYPDAKNIVQSRTPTVGVSYAATTSKSINHEQKTFKTIATQTNVLPVTVTTSETNAGKDKPAGKSPGNNNASQRTKN